MTEISLRVLGYLSSRKENLCFLDDVKSFNIICIGDSFTYGAGVNAAYSYPKQLERMLNNGNLLRNFKVFNLGIPGSNSSQHLKYLKIILARYEKPNLIIILTGANDSWNFTDSNIFIVMDKNNKKLFNPIGMKFRLFFSELRIYKILKFYLTRSKAKTSEFDESFFRQMKKNNDEDEQTLKKLLEYNLMMIIRLAQVNNIQIILQNYPRDDIGPNTTKDFAFRFNIPFVDNADVFRQALKSLSSKDLFLYDNSHPNKEGYRIMATGIYEVICQKILSKRYYYKQRNALVPGAK